MKTILSLESEEDLAPRRQLIFEALHEGGYQIKVLCWNRSGKAVKQEKCNGLLFERVGVKANYVDVKAIFKIPIIYFIFFRKIFCEKPDVIFCGHFVFLPLAVIAGKILKSKVFYDVMEYYVQNFFQRVHRWAQPFEAIVSKAEDSLVKRIDGVTTIPSYRRFLLQKLRVHNSNVEEIKNVPVTYDEYCLESCYQRFRLEMESGKFIIYAGTISAEWGILKLLKAIVIVKNRYPDIKCLIIGKSRRGYEKLVADFVNSKSISKNVKLCHSVPYRDLFAYLRTAYAGVVPLQPVNKFKLVGNGTSRKVFEYMNAGLPVVAPDFGELAQAVREEQCGILVDSTKPEQIAEAIIFLLDHPETAAEMGRKGRKAIERKYNWNKEKEKLLKVFDRLWEVGVHDVKDER